MDRGAWWTTVYGVAKNQTQLSTHARSFFTLLCQFLEQNESAICVYIYIYIPCFMGFPSYLGHHRAPNRVPCAVHQVLINYILYIY